MNALFQLQWCVEKKIIRLFDLFYPIVSPKVRKEWVASYEDPNTEEQIFGQGSSNIFLACENLIQKLNASEIPSIPEDHNTFNLETRECINKLIDFIDQRIDIGDFSWMLSFEYNPEFGLDRIWCAAIEGGEFITSPIEKYAKNLSYVCSELYQDLFSKKYL